MPARLSNVLNLQSMTMMMDQLLSTGLVLHAIRAMPFGHEHTQIVIKARRDAYNEGYLYLDKVEGNTVRYHTELDIKNQAWSTNRSGGTGTSSTPTGQRSVQNTTATESAGSKAGQSAGFDTGHFAEAEGKPEYARGQSTRKGGYEQEMASRRDTLFVSSKASQHAGDVEFTLSLTKTWVPGDLYKYAGLHLAAAWWQDTGDWRSREHTAVRVLRERVVIQDALIHHEDIPAPLPPGRAALEEMDARLPLPGPAPDITAEDFAAGEVISLGLDHAKLGFLAEEALAKWGDDNDRPLSGQHSAAVAALVKNPRARDALRYLLSYTTLTRKLQDLLGDGLTMPVTLQGPSGAFSETFADLKVQVELVWDPKAEPNPQTRGYVTAWNEAGAYKFDEREQDRSRTAGYSWGLTGGGGVNTGNLKASPLSAKKRVADTEIAPSFGSTATRATRAVLQTMTRFEMTHRSGAWLRISPNAIFTLTLTPRTMPLIAGEKSKRPQPEPEGVALRWDMSNALELALSPEKSVRLETYQPQGIPVGAGTFFPPPRERRPAGTTIGDLVRGPFSINFLELAFLAMVDFDGQHFRAGNRKLDAAGLAAEITKRLGQLGPPPNPEDPEDLRPPPAPTRLDSPEDPILLIAPSVGVIPPGHTVAPAQALADALSRPVLAPDSGYVIGRDGSVNVVRLPAPDATAFGRGTERGNFVAFFPRHAPILREMAKADVRAVTEMDNELFSEQAAWSRPQYEDALGSPAADRHFLVAEEGGRVVGAAALIIADGRARVETLGVTGRQQGRGIGSALLAALLAEAGRRGHREVFLTVRADNPRARRLYQAHGFEQVGSKADHFGEGIAALDMRLDLAAAGRPGDAARPIRSRAPVPLGYNLAGAISAAQRDLGWALRLGPRPGLVPPPTRDVHFPGQTPQSAIEEWQRGIKATRQLAAVAREFLSEHGGPPDGDLRARLDAADLAVRAVPGPPPATEQEPASAQELAAAWPSLARFQRAAAELGSAAAAAVAPAITQWQQDFSSSTSLSWPRRSAGWTRPCTPTPPRRRCCSPPRPRSCPITCGRGRSSSHGSSASTAPWGERSVRRSRTRRGQSGWLTPPAWPRRRTGCCPTPARRATPCGTGSTRPWPHSPAGLRCRRTHRT